MKRLGLIFLVLILCFSSVIVSAEREITKMGSLEMFGADSEMRQMITVEHLLRAHSLMYENVIDYRYDDLTSMLAALDAGEVDAISLRSSTGRYLVSKNPRYEIIETDDQWSESFSIMTMEENAGVFDLLNDAIIKLKENGTLEHLAEEHIESCIAGEEPKGVEIPYNNGARVVRVAVTCDVPPMDYATEDGIPVGFNAALLREIALQTDLNIEMVTVGTSARSAALSSGRVDAIFWVKLFECNRDECENEILYRESLPDTIVTQSYYTDNVVVIALKGKV